MKDKKSSLHGMENGKVCWKKLSENVQKTIFSREKLLRVILPNL
jgi:hypothetical protein